MTKAVMRVTKTGKYDYNANRNRKRFRVTWIGVTDEYGFMTHGKQYTVIETQGEHYHFLNNFKVKDLAHSRWFTVQGLNND